MKRFRFGLASISIVLAVILAGITFGQVQNLPPHLRRSTNNPDQEAYRQIQIQRTLEAQQQTAMRRAEAEARASAKPRELMPSISGEDLRRIERLLTPHPDDIRKYKTFLDLDRTGIFKLFPQSVCDESRIVRVDGECANSVPGGSRYSFRAASKTPDIHYLNDKFYVKGFFANHLLANVGSVPLEELVDGDKYVRPLSEFVPSTDFDGARSQSGDIEEGLLLGGTKYANQAEILLESTYLLRIIAYKNGNNLQRRLARSTAAIDDPVHGFEKLLTDHRLDLIVAFRVIRKDEHGNLTLIWRELARRKPPVITFPEDQRMADFN